MTRTEELTLCLAAVVSAERCRDQALADKQAAETAFDQAVSACRSKGFDWSGGLPDPGPAGDELRAAAKAAYAEHDRARRELKQARSRLDAAYLALGKAVAA